MLIAWKVLKPFRDRKKRFIVLFGFFSANHSRTTEGISTGKTLQERFSWDLSDRSNSKVCLHLKFMRKFAFLLCFLPFWESSWWLSKNLHANVLAFLQGLYLASSAFKDYTKSLTIVLGLAKSNVAAKKAHWGKTGNLKKAIFLVLRQNRCRYCISECSIGKMQKYNS